VLYQFISFIGAAMILGAYFAYQRGPGTRRRRVGWGRESRWFNLLNFVGAALVTWVAVAGRQWGIALLEGTWALLSLFPLISRRASGR
jgi:hypothetical protein